MFAPFLLPLDALPLWQRFRWTALRWHVHTFTFPLRQSFRRAALRRHLRTLTLFDAWCRLPAWLAGYDLRHRSAWLRGVQTFTVISTRSIVTLSQWLVRYDLRHRSAWLRSVHAIAIIHAGPIVALRLWARHGLRSRLRRASPFIGPFLAWGFLPFRSELARRVIAWLIAISV